MNYIFKTISLMLLFYSNALLSTTEVCSNQLSLLDRPTELALNALDTLVAHDRVLTNQEITCILHNLILQATEQQLEPRAVLTKLKNFIVQELESQKNERRKPLRSASIWLLGAAIAAGLLVASNSIFEYVCNWQLNRIEKVQLEFGDQNIDVLYNQVLGEYTSNAPGNLDENQQLLMQKLKRMSKAHDAMLHNQRMASEMSYKLTEYLCALTFTFITFNLAKNNIPQKNYVLTAALRIVQEYLRGFVR